MPPPTITLNGKAYIVPELAEYERLSTLAKAADLPHCLSRTKTATCRPSSTPAPPLPET